MNVAAIKLRFRKWWFARSFVHDENPYAETVKLKQNGMSQLVYMEQARRDRRSMRHPWYPAFLAERRRKAIEYHESEVPAGE